MNITNYNSLLLPMKSPYCSLPIMVTANTKNWTMRRACYWYMWGICRLILFGDSTSLDAFNKRHPQFSLRVDGVRYTAIDKHMVNTWLCAFGHEVA
jgi:hypothetical protein